jgi:hypothetical protein
VSTLLANELTTIAARGARVYFERNRDALVSHQPALTIADVETDHEWLFARDRSLTLHDPHTSRWLAGCSVPRRAAVEIFRKLVVTGGVSCFLAPEHAGQIRVALDRLEPRQAIIAIIPDRETLATILCCDDFTQDFREHRLWLVAGESWEMQLRDLLAAHPGLPIPSQFIRLPQAPGDATQELIAAAQRLFSDFTNRRGELLIAARQTWPKRPTATETRLCLLAPSRFQLWGDAGLVLSDALGPAARRIDPDDPAMSSPLALAQTAAECDAVVTADYARADLPGVLPDDLPWLTWITTPRIPASVPTARNDALLLADARLRDDARAAGWPADRLQVAQWPGSIVNAQAAKTLAIIADTWPVSPPESLNEYSSHVVLWEQIAHELSHDAFALGDDVDAYLIERMRRLEISADANLRLRLIRELIVPTYQQSLAQLLISERHALELHGRGWDRIPELAAHARGPVTSREQLVALLTSPIAAVRAWPARMVHPIDGAGVPLVHPGRDRKSSLSAATRALNGSANSAPPQSTSPILSRALIVSLLAHAQ